eukprot:1618611-Rhodomonas_salina.1
MHHTGQLEIEEACCSNPGCEGVLEDLSHAFLTCPAVAPAAEWVCRFFEVVAECPPPPRTAQVLLGDNQ